MQGDSTLTANQGGLITHQPPYDRFNGQLMTTGDAQRKRTNIFGFITQSHFNDP